MIETKDEKLETYLTTRTKNYIITKENKIIEIKNIKNIKIID